LVKHLKFNFGNKIKKAVEYYRSGESEKAGIICKEILKINPNHSDSLYLLGLMAFRIGRVDEAINLINEAVLKNPKNPQYYVDLGIAFQAQGEVNKAISCFQKAVQLKPDFSSAYNNLGIAFKKQGRIDEAINCYQKALKLNPDMAEFYFNLGIAFQGQNKTNEAISCYQKALKLKTDFAEACNNLVRQFQQTCAWQELEAMTVKLDGLTRKAMDIGKKPAESPYINITTHTDVSIHFAVAKSWSLDISRAMANLKMHFSFDDRRTDKTRIIVGYLSNEFCNHATAHLMLSLFGLHNREEFEIFCYSYGKDDGSYYRKRIQRDCDKFVDISRLSDGDAARCINGDQVDIIVDLKGYTKGARLAICALRPAPVQVSYLGFPGTTGADFFDYIFTDKIVTPKDHAPYYSENFVYLPHCYQVNDHTQSISNKDWKKEDFGLPENSFVLCSFNRPYKIDPVMFDVWMRILQQVPESVLWLLFRNKIAEKNLIHEAEARGVKSERLIFTDKIPKDEHLARLRLADLALDTRIVNGHTTTSDTLWAGVPVITLQGSHFASRVSSSILSAIGVPELITHSLQEYEALAVRLAHHPLELQAIRQKITENRLVAPLFDTPRFVRNLEKAYKEMWKIFLSRETPRQIEVLDN
jgi:protein O-GlcNAc transferase